jgi:glycosyltransferase involved in cell wall biosynthesis
MQSPLRLPKTYILQNAYISLARCAEDYRRILTRLGCLAPSLAEAEVVILHQDFDTAQALLANVPALKAKRLVGYLVWETDRLPERTQGTFDQLDAVWTPSWYSAKSMVQRHPEMMWLPHVVRPPVRPSPAAVAHLTELLGPKPRCALVQIGRPNDPRKGFSQVERAVRAAAEVCPGLVLVQKTDGFTGQTGLGSRRDGPIVQLWGHLDDDLMAALYARSHFVISGHHAEGWGLTLSEGMAAGVPGIAADYSGNMAFMQPDTGILIPGYEAEIHKTDAWRSFAAPMRWHYPLPGQIQKAIKQGYASTGTASYAAMASRAQRAVRAYDAAHVTCIMRSLLLRVITRPKRHPLTSIVPNQVEASPF